jgi:hypothetical protein
MRSRTTPVAPVCASAAAPAMTLARAMLVSLMFMGFLLVSGVEILERLTTHFGEAVDQKVSSSFGHRF